MANKVEGYMKLQIPDGKATPAPPVGSDQESMQDPVRFRRAEQEQSCNDHKSSASGDRRDEDA